MELYPHQRKAVEKMHNGCILMGGVGVGKTATALAYFYEKVCLGVWENQQPTPAKTPRDLYIITTARKRDEKDWQHDAMVMLGLTEEGSYYNQINMVVDSYNNISKYESVKDAFFIFDEQRLVGKGAWVKSFVKIARANQWILLSATPGDNWSDYIPVFIANGYFKTRTEFLRNHVIYKRGVKYPAIDRYFNTDILERYRKNLLVEMYMDRHTTRNLVTIKVPYDQANYRYVTTDRWNIFKNEPASDIGDLMRVQRRIVNEDPSRLGCIRALLKKHPRLIVYYSFDYEREILWDLAKDVKVAEWSGHKHEPVPEGDSWVYLVQYTAGSEAWNCTTTDAMVFYSMQYSYKVFEQCQGRIDRLNTPYKDLWYYILKSNANIDNHLKRAIDEKRDFNLSAYAERIGYDS